MKNKMLPGLLIIALIFTSCSKDEVRNVYDNDPDGIGFDISTGKTRANVIDIDAMKGATDGFGVYATNGASANEFIANKAYKYDEVAGAWKWAESNIAWPSTEAGYPVNFYAYYPLSSASLTSNLLANYTVAATPGTQVDFLAAKHTGVHIKPSSGNVVMAFKHILSKIGFKVVTGTAMTVEVQSVSVKKVGDNGTFDFAALAWSASPNTYNSSYDYMMAPVDAANIFAGATAGEEVAGSDGSLMLMPQDLSDRAWDKTATGLTNQSYIEVVYRVYETATGKNIVGYTDALDHRNNNGGLVTGSLFVKVAYPLSTNWLMGKAYTYTIHLGTSDSSGGNLIADNFVAKDGSDSGLPVITPDTKEPIEIFDPVFPDKPIGFIVSVGEWGDETGHPLK